MCVSFLHLCVELIMGYNNLCENCSNLKQKWFQLNSHVVLIDGKKSNFDNVESALHMKSLSIPLIKASPHTNYHYYIIDVYLIISLAQLWNFLWWQEFEND